MQGIALSKANRILLARAFNDNRRVDMSIDCVVEGLMGKAYGDNPGDPIAYMIEMGPFRYYAGDANSPGGLEMVKAQPPDTMLMPSPDEWFVAARKIHGGKLMEYPRCSFSPESLSVGHLKAMLHSSGFGPEIRQFDDSIAEQFYGGTEDLADLSAFESAEDFVRRGIGFYLEENETITAVAYSSLACARGIEISIVVLPEHRRKGIATALACKLLIHCLEKGTHPNWDAANPESCRLAEKLGYTATGSYTEYYLSP